MSLTRRGFLGAILAACAAPAVVRASSLMKVAPIEPPEGMVATESGILVPEEPRLFQVEIGQIDRFVVHTSPPVLSYHWRVVDGTGKVVSLGKTESPSLTINDLKMDSSKVYTCEISCSNPSQLLTLTEGGSETRNARKKKEPPKNIPHGPSRRKKYA